MPGAATLHPVCAERRAVSTFALPGERLSFDSAHGARREQYAAIFVRPGYIVDVQALKDNRAIGVVQLNQHNLQVVIGPQVQSVKDEMVGLMNTVQA
ncbi:hypothetical protein HF809_000572 [Salmonella enterica]|nr:hypothetical protein [Salmonella enterica]